MKNSADIFRDPATNEIVVLDEKGIEIFRRPKSEQMIAVAHSIYLSCKHPKERSLST